MFIAIWTIGSLVAGALLLFFGAQLIGLTIIADDAVGIITKKFAFKNLPQGRMVALEGEAGIQADTLPPGWHFFYWPWQYSVEKVKVISVPESQIALIISNDGATIEEGRTLADPVECDNFQDARKFLVNGGCRGRQIQILRTGLYRINTRLFDVVTSANASKHGISSDALRVLSIASDCVGIVTTHDGAKLPEGEIASASVAGHRAFQDANAFIVAGGFRGLQQEVLMPGSWTINPWFATVEVVTMTEVPVAHVGVVVSRIGDIGEDVSGEDFRNGTLVETGKRGVWRDPYNPGLYPLNLRTMEVEIVPTSNFVLNWAHKTESHDLDKDLSSITVRSRDGFSLNLDVQQIIHVPHNVAPRLIARFGSMANLVQNVLEPIIGNYFRNAGQDSDALDFIRNRSERQKAAKEFVRLELKAYDVEGVDTLIGDINVPEELTETLRERKIAQESQLTIETKMETQRKQQQLERETAIAEQMPALVTAQQRALIATEEAKAATEEATGRASVARIDATGAADALKTSEEAVGLAALARARPESESIKLKAEANANEISLVGAATAKATEQLTAAVGQQNYATMKVAEYLSAGKLKLVPDIVMGGSGAGGDAASTLLQMIAVRQLEAGLASAKPETSTAPAKPADAAVDEATQPARG